MTYPTDDLGPALRELIRQTEGCYVAVDREDRASLEELVQRSSDDEAHHDVRLRVMAALGFRAGGLPIRVAFMIESLCREVRNAQRMKAES